MIVNSDAKSLEINCAAYLSQDPVLLEEVRNGFDMHSSNQEILGLPSRLIAKVFVFRLIYGGSAYAYSVDQDFASCGFSKKKWESVITRFYDKYQGLAKWHATIVQQVTQTGELTMPTGRVYKYKPTQDIRGGVSWPRTTILNYPVQGLGADLMSIVRVSLHRNLAKLKIPKQELCLVNTVHDSVVLDLDTKHLDVIVEMLYNTYENVPKNFKALFGKEYNLPLFQEVSIGPNMKDLKEISRP
jgi:DNA polymerase I